MGAMGVQANLRATGRGAAGGAAEFDTQVPHWFGSTGEEQAEVLSIFGRPGERMLVRAAGDHQESHRDPHSD
jgi:hypothetical protein